MRSWFLSNANLWRLEGVFQGELLATLNENPRICSIQRLEMKNLLTMLRRTYNVGPAKSQPTA